MSVDRRTFLKGAAAGAGLVLLGERVARADRKPATPIETVVVLMMENRSVDHYLGWRGNEAEFDAAQHRQYLALDGAPVVTEHWGAGSSRSDYAGCDFNDPGHGWDAGRVQKVDHSGSGEPEGWLQRGSGNDEFAVSYYEPADIPVLANIVRDFTAFDRYFCSVLAPTWPNREYMHSAQSAGLKGNSTPPEAGWNDGFPWPTIWTALDRAGVTWAYYYSNLPFIGLWGTRHFHGSRHVANFYADAGAGRLPQVSYIDPWFVVPEGLANDDHPHADVRLGQQFISDVVQAFIESPQWESGALFITYDEWGGFWDHVMPPEVHDPRPKQGFGQLGFRVPTMLVSPYSRGGRTNSGLYDHTSILKFLETNWGLEPLSKLHPGARDAHSRNIGKAFDFKHFDPEVDLARFAYTAPAEARVPCDARGHTMPASDLWPLAENGWLDAQGFRLDHRFEDCYRRSLV